MLAIGRLHGGVIVTGALVIAAILDCGGKTTGGSSTDADAGSGGTTSLGGSTGSGGTTVMVVGGNTSFGGSTTATTVVAPRVPAVHRAEALSCIGVFSPPEPPSTLIAASNACTKHADCTEGANGKCAASGVGMGGGYYYCNYDQCATDADCGTGRICYCTASDAAGCLSVGNCLTDADCGGGSYSYCSPSMGWDCGGYHSIDGFHCHTPNDTCIDDTDCTGANYCNYDVYQGKWQCMAINNGCAIG
jgi:hypothetical protein